MNAQKPSDDAMDVIVGTAVYSFTSALIATGMSPTDAARCTAFAIIEGTLGRKMLETLNIPRQTAARWRRELAAAAEVGQGLDPEALMVDIANVMLPSLGLRDLRIVRGSSDDG